MSSTKTSTTTGKYDPEYPAESNLGPILSVTGAVHAIAFAVVVMRIYARIGILKAAGKDDYTMAACITCAFVGLLCFILQGYHGLVTVLGYDCPWAAQDLHRLLPSSTEYQQMVFAVVVGADRLRGVLHCVAWLTILLQCQPVDGFWNKMMVPKPKCYGMLMFIKFGMANAGFNIFTDICFASLPIPIIVKLQLRLRTRIYLILILSLGYFAVALGVVKAYYQIGFGADKDKTFNQSIQFWGFLQLNVGIIAASCPALKPFVGTAVGLSRRGKTYGNYNNIVEPGPAAGNGDRGVQHAVGGRSRTAYPADGCFEMQEQNSC
ncbi:hypothetical protein PG994_012117 [Apiospora phragmitis]|uniref:Rhodopsin domain-containing protein n=1 Tax=Apiospora phragmitis TaxID=2905665 RepID=A0ABR1TUW1_9PEZI